METRQLEYFVAVAEELNFTRAAARLFAVQSTVSAAIASLEQELGAPLFDRSTKRVALTPAGEALLPEARAAIETIDRVRSSVALSAGAIRGRLRVGIFTSLTVLDLPALFGEFHSRFPLVDLQLSASPQGSTGFTDDVRRGLLDVAFMGLPPVDLAGFAVQEIDTAVFVAVLPTGHPLAGAKHVSVAELVSEPFVDTPVGFGNRVILERALARAGLARTVSTVVADLGAIPPFVEAGLGIAVIPGSLVFETRGTVVVPLKPERLEWTLSVITREKPSPAASALLELMRERSVV